MGIRELDAFAEECAAIDATLAEVGDRGWGQPALGEWSVAELVAHLVRGVTRIAAYLDAEPGGDAPVWDRVSYWRFDLAAAAPDVARRARAEAAEVPHAELPRRFAEGWRRSVARARDLPADHLTASLRGPMRLDDYVATRVLEAVVHHMDLRAALGQPPVSTVAAARITMAVLEGLLGSPRPRNLGRARFIKAATGRIPGPDDRFPVLR